MAIIKVADFGAVGDGINGTDDTAALLAAMAAAPNSAVIELSGMHKITQSLDGTSKNLSLQGHGCRQGNAGATGLTGNVAGPLWKCVYPAGGYHVCDVAAVNYSPTGIAMQIGGVNIALERNYVSGQIGLKAERNTFTLAIRSMQAVRAGNPVGSIGLLLGGHCSVYSADVVGWDEGIRACGVGVDMRNMRVEVNRTGLRLGYDETGVFWGLNAILEAVTLEANDLGIDIGAMSGRIAGFHMQGSSNAPSGMSKIGVLARAGDRLTVSNSHFGGAFTDVAIRLEGAGAQKWSHVSASNGLNPAKLWDVRRNLAKLIFEECPGVVNHPGDAGGDLRRGGAIHALRQINYVQATKEGKNLRGLKQPVTEGAGSHQVVFATDKTSGAAAIFTAVAETGAGTLVPGTYYYIASMLTEHGETGVFGEKVVTVAVPNNQVKVQPYGNVIPGGKRRLYRGTSSGVYDGYFETPLSPTGPWIDAGQPFDGFTTPNAPGAGSDGETGMQEPDSDYAVVPSASWPTTIGVSAKGTAGFTLTFGTPAPAGGTVDWVMVR